MSELAEYRDGAVDLLGVLAYGALTGFARLADDAKLAPSLPDKVHVSAMAARQFEHYRSMADRLTELGVDAVEAMAPFHEPFDAFHTHTAPKTWLDGLIKAYVADQMAADFYREIAAYVDPRTRQLVHDVLADEGHAEFVVANVCDAIAQQPEVAGRLALWARRLVGEAMSQAQRVAAEREALTSLLTGSVDRPGVDLAAVSRMFTRMLDNHTARMARLGLQS